MKETVLITGASAGIGKATARLLLDKGYAVWGAARRLERMKDLEASGLRALELDITRQSSAKAGVERINRESGAVDILINNAGYGSFGALEDIPIEETRNQFEVNVFGLIRLTKLVLPQMRKKGKGKIVNVTSVGGKLGEAMGSLYHSTKYAIEGLSDSLRLELSPFGIDVIIIEPGPIITEFPDLTIDKMMKVSGSGAYAKMARSQAKILSLINDEKTSTRPEVVAKTILKAISAKKPQARYPTGRAAKFMTTYRKLASDRMMDGLMRAIVKRYG